MRISDWSSDVCSSDLLVSEHTDLAVEQRAIDPAALAGLVAPAQRGKDADDRVDAREQIGHGVAGLGLLAGGIAGDRHRAAHALAQALITRPLGQIRCSSFRLSVCHFVYISFFS